MKFPSLKIMLALFSLSAVATMIFHPDNQSHAPNYCSKESLTHKGHSHDQEPLTASIVKPSVSEHQHHTSQEENNVSSSDTHLSSHHDSHHHNALTPEASQPNVELDVVEPSTPTPKPDVVEPSTPTPKPDVVEPSTPAPKPDVVEPSTPAPAPKPDVVEPSTPAPKPNVIEPSVPSSEHHHTHSNHQWVPTYETRVVFEAYTEDVFKENPIYVKQLINGDGTNLTTAYNEYRQNNGTLDFTSWLSHADGALKDGITVSNTREEMVISHYERVPAGQITHPAVTEDVVSYWTCAVTNEVRHQTEKPTDTTINP